MAPRAASLSVLLALAHGANDDEASMLQMPIVNEVMATDLDTNECRCPGYYQDECEKEWAQGCEWSDAGQSNGAWCQCLNEPIADPLPRPYPICCQALTADCMACAAQQPVVEFCAERPGVVGCESFTRPVTHPPPPPLCCQALTADCMACAERTTVEEFCAGNPTVMGCESFNGPVTIPPRPCCRALTADCMACTAQTSVEEFCAGNPRVSGCEGFTGPVTLPPPFCCQALTANCMACAAQTSVEEFCAGNPRVSGCEGFTGPVTLPPPVCCEALTANCMACAAQTSVEEFCAGNPRVSGCEDFIGPVTLPPPPPPVCCEALTANCMACAAQTSVEEFCAGNPRVSGCEDFTGPVTLPPPFCCLAQTAECLACSLSTTVELYCEQHPLIPGCPEMPSSEECCVEDAAEVCFSVYPRAAMMTMTMDHTLVTVTFGWNNGLCEETHVACCRDPNLLGCVACNHGVAMEDFCGTADALDYAEVCLTGAECCAEEPRPEGCDNVHFPWAMGMGFTTDYTRIGTSFRWSNGECFQNHLMCCGDQTRLECVACMNNIAPVDLCSDEHADNFPDFCHTIINPPSGEECCVAEQPEACADINYLRAIGDGYTTDHTEVGVVFEWNGGACFEMHTACCWDESQLGCIACRYGVSPEAFCETADAIGHPEVCLSGEDCCVGSPDEACSRILFPRVVGMATTTDYSELGTTHAWTSGECFTMTTMCCRDMSRLECVACINTMAPGDLCEERGSEFPSVCIQVEPPRPFNPALCCAESPPDECSGVDVLTAIGDGFVTDFRQVGVTYEWTHGACFESHFQCCQDQNRRECMACINSVLPENLCDAHSETFPQFCLAGSDCCMESPPRSCSSLHFPRAIGMGFTTDYTQTGKTYTWSNGACIESDTLCCQSTDLIECVACMNNVLPGDFCDVHSNHQLCAPPPPVDVCGHANGFPSPAVIRNSHSDRRLYARDGVSGEMGVGADAGGNIAEDQWWNLEDAGDGSYFVTNSHSDRRLFAQASGTGEVGVGALATGERWADQRWFIEEDSDCTYIFRNVHSGRRLFSQRDRSGDDGVGAMATGQLWADQKWFIDEA